jgi:hypothetical protein
MAHVAIMDIAMAQPEMAPGDPCIGTQIELASISSGDTILFELTGTSAVSLQISDDDEIILRRLENGQYVSGPIAVSAAPGDTLVII